jgi:DNA polymerase-3 subunit beta
MLDQLNVAVKAVSSHSTMEILKCVVLSAGENSFELLASNGEMSINTAPAACEVTELGAVALEFRMFYDIIRRLPDGAPIKISVQKNNITLIKSGRSEFKILGSNPEEYPAQPDVKQLGQYMVNAGDLKKGIGQTIFSVSMDMTKPALMGVLLEVADDCLRLVTVDGFRISYTQIPVTRGENTGDEKAIVPANTMSEISKLIGSDESICVSVGERHIVFKTEIFTMTSNLIAGEFLNYVPIFSEDYTTQITLPRVDFIDSLERVSLIASRDIKKNPIKLEISDELLIITSNTEIGTAYDELRIDCDGENLIIAFNPKYILDAARAVEEDIVNIKMTTALSPCTIRGLNNQDAKFLILPLRVK